MSKKKGIDKKGEAISNRLLIHMVWAFLSLLTIMYFKMYYTGLGVLEGMDTVRSASTVLLIIGAVITLAFTVYILLARKKGVDFQIVTFNPAVSILWPLAYTVYMALFVSFRFDFGMLFTVGYIALGVFVVLYLLSYLKAYDLLFTAVSLLVSEVLFYFYSRLHVHTVFFKNPVPRIIYFVILAGVGVYYIVKVASLKKEHGVCKKCDKRILPKKALYFPSFILGGLHTVCALATAVVGYQALRLSCYAIALYAVVACVAYIIATIYKK
ncbi:MAG: hypothetical protein IKJ17_03535 [Clostridia bacterium]|nr:hypothetical protein [Clostridia bacterium]